MRGERSGRAGRLGRGAIVALVASAWIVGAAGCGQRRSDRGPKEILTGDALYRSAIEALSEGETRKARERLEKIERFGDEDLKPLVQLSLADIVYYQGDDLSLTEARSKYLDFVTLYRDHPLAPYAQFQSGVCALRQVNHPSRDQRQTRTAIDNLRQVLVRYPESPYADAARDMIAVAESNLAEHQFIVGRFYEKRKAWKAAADRFRSILEDFPRYPEKDKVYFHLGQVLVRQDKTAEARVYLERLVNEYAEGEFAAQARKLLRSVADEPRAANGDPAGDGGRAGR